MNPTRPTPEKTVGLPAPRVEAAPTPLRPYQHDAVEALTAGLHDPDSMGQLRAACGTGKTRMSIENALRVVPPTGTAAVVAPSLAVVAQTLAAWRAAGFDDALAVCSDTGVADTPVHAGDLTVPVTTDPAEITDWLRRSPTGRRVVVSTYLSAHKLAEALRAHPVADLIVFDEAHHLAGRPDYTTRKALDPAWLPAARRMFMTATPRVDDVRANTAGALSMSDTTLFGPVLYDYPFPRAIAEGHLDDYRVVVVGVTDAQVRALLADEERLYTDRGVDIRTAVAQVALARARERYGIRRALSFHPRVEHAQDFARTLAATLSRLPGDHTAGLYAKCVHGEMTATQRRPPMHRLAHPDPDGWTVLSNALCLSEGIDVPAVDAVLFAGRKESPTAIIQAIGRALRHDPAGTGTATIVVGIVVPDAGGEIGDLDPGEHETLWRVLRALRSIDEPLGVELDNRRSRGHVDNPRLPNKITVMLPDGTSDTFLRDLSVLAVRQTTSPWWDGHSAAVAWHAEHGHLDVPLRHVTDKPAPFALGQWIVKQRRHHRKGWLAADRVAALEKLDIEWDPIEARWRATLEVARAWHTEHGHLDLPQSAVRDGVNLGHWIISQRAAARTGTLAPHRRRALDEIGMVWVHPRTTAFDRNTALLKAYRDREGHADVPQTHVEAGVKLGKWVSQMRARRASLGLERVWKLEAAGMRWSVDPRWEIGLKAARAWQAEHGDLDVPRDTVVDTVPLDRWLTQRRREYTTGKLTHECFAALDALGMQWSTDRENTFDAGMAAARSWHHRHPGQAALDVPAGHVEDGFPLAAWLVNRRRDRRQGTLTPEREQALNALGMIWDHPEHVWQRGLAAARAWQAEHGHLRPPAGAVVEGVDLNTWINARRQARRAGRLAPERVAALDELGIDWSPPVGHGPTTRDAAWERGLAAAVAWHARTGHLSAPRGTNEGGVDLQAWLSRQRKAQREGTLPPSRVAALDELGIDWNPRERPPPATGPLGRQGTR